MNGAQLLDEYERDPQGAVVQLGLDRLADEAERHSFHRHPSAAALHALRRGPRPAELRTTDHRPVGTDQRRATDTAKATAHSVAIDIPATATHNAAIGKGPANGQDPPAGARGPPFGHGRKEFATLTECAGARPPHPRTTCFGSSLHQAKTEVRSIGAASPPPITPDLEFAAIVLVRASRTRTPLYHVRPRHACRRPGLLLLDAAPPADLSRIAAHVPPGAP